MSKLSAPDGQLSVAHSSGYPERTPDYKLALPLGRMLFIPIHLGRERDTLSDREVSCPGTRQIDSLGKVEE